MRELKVQKKRQLKEKKQRERRYRNQDKLQKSKSLAWRVLEQETSNKSLFGDFMVGG
ncbi:hypothetical protein HBZS_115140 [Helicobacter bizzozeronii CCUG 35545]|nr:hypothetical protein HBZS_115140 [Helicobacter bizzozeronii CCUG 35545]